MPVARNGLQNKEPIEILAQFNGEIRGIYNYYRLAPECICPEQVLYSLEYTCIRLFKEMAESQEHERPHICTEYETKTRDKISLFNFHKVFQVPN